MRRRKSEAPAAVRPPHVLPRLSVFILLSSIFTLLLLTGCPGEDLTPPDVTIIAPADGDSIAGATTIRARAIDNTSVARVEFYVDSARVGIDTTPAGQVFEYAWAPGVARPGTAHTLRCSAVDDAGNRNSSPVVTVYISSTIGTHHSGTIADDEVWTAAGSPHVIDSDLYVDAFLTLAPGVTVLVADGATIAVGTHSPAGIAARGRADSAITFSALNVTPGPGAWDGIEFRTNAVPDSSILRHCVAEHAGGGGALVRSTAGRVVIDSCEFRSSSGWGVAASGTGLGRLSQSAFSECAGYPVSVPVGLVSALGTGNTFSDNARDAVELAGGTVAVTDTWPHLGVPYCITATVTVADSSNPLLTIAPGCSLLFSDSAKLRVGVGQPGGLRADGTYGRIVFGPLAVPPGPGRWRGIEFWEQTDPVRTILNYCRIEGAGAGNSAALTCYSAAILLANSRVADNAGDGIHCQNTGFARFENDTITGCAGYPLHIGAQYVSTIGGGNSFAGNGKATIQVTEGKITRDAQYRRQDVPYLITGTVEVGSQQYQPLLVIESGVELRFDHGSGISVGLAEPGRLQAIGVPDSITFTGAIAEPGAWRGLELNSYASSLSRLEQCRLLYGGEGSHGILRIDSCVPVLRGNEIAFSSNYCVYMQNTDLEPDSLRANNWLHDWAGGFEDIFYEP